jgi:hypothetical protein
LSRIFPPASSPSFEQPGRPAAFPHEPLGLEPLEAAEWRQPRPGRGRPWVHALLLLLTLVTTTWAGSLHYIGFAADFQLGPDALPRTAILLGLFPVPLEPGYWLAGLWYSGTILTILGAHELGHYYACRYHRVNASLPYFLPVPLWLTGTLGAFIRIRQPIRTKAMLFDIGVAGPIAGFVLAVPALFFGVALSRVVALPPDFVGASLGEPALFQLAAWLLWGPVPEGHSINLHPMGFAAWFGLLATALNLFPVGQLDGGHISYAVLGRRSTYITLGTVAVIIGLTFVSVSWILWAVLMIVMLITFGPRHPQTMDDHVPLDRTRIGIALAAALIFALCFTPAPIEPYALLQTGP